MLDTLRDMGTADLNPRDNQNNEGLQAHHSWQATVVVYQRLEGDQIKCTLRKMLSLRANKSFWYTKLLRFVSSLVKDVGLLRSYADDSFAVAVAALADASSSGFASSAPMTVSSSSSLSKVSTSLTASFLSFVCPGTGGSLSWM